MKCRNVFEKESELSPVISGGSFRLFFNGPSKSPASIAQSNKQWVGTSAASVAFRKCVSNPVAKAQKWEENVLGKDEKDRKKSTAERTENTCVFRETKQRKVKMHKTIIIKHIKVTKRRKNRKLY